MATESSELLFLETLLCVFFVGVFTVLNTYLPKWNVRVMQIIFIHESGICLIIGILSGFLLKLTIGTLSTFDSGIFFNFMLPIIVLGAGFNMNRERFFKNVGSIILLGVGGSIIAFVLIGAIMYYLSAWDYLYWKGEYVHITIQDGMLVGATLAATDVVCTLAFIKEHKTPRLHSILFGESVSNDAIAIVLLATVNKVKIDEIDTDSTIKMIEEFMFICFSSVFVGILFGLLSALVLKIFKSIEEWPSRQTGVVLFVLWIGYITAEILDISGVICILISSIVSGHYSTLNMNPESRILSHSFYHFIGDGAEALVFAYLGLTAYSYDLFSVPPLFIFYMVLGMIVARFVGTFILCYFVTLVSCGKYNLGFKNMVLIWIGGVVRGGISFALAMSISGDNEEILRIVILVLVIVGTLFFGSFLPIVVKIVNVTEPTGNLVHPEGSERPSKFIMYWKHFNENVLMNVFVRKDYNPKYEQHS